MKKIKLLLFIAFVSAVLTDCSVQQDPSADGSSISKAIKVKRVRQEYKYVEKACPDCKIDGEALITVGDNHYHKLICSRPDGKTVEYIFNIDSFY